MTWEALHRFVDEASDMILNVKIILDQKPFTIALLVVMEFMMEKNTSKA